MRGAITPEVAPVFVDTPSGCGKHLSRGFVTVAWLARPVDARPGSRLCRAFLTP